MRAPWGADRRWPLLALLEMHVVNPGQLVLDLGDPAPDQTTSGNTNGHRRMNKKEAGLSQVLPAGAERLLAAMVKRGLPEGDLKVAAALALALDEPRAGAESE